MAPEGRLNFEDVYDSRARLVVISSPKDEKPLGWMKQLTGGVLTTAYMINPLFLKELLLTGFVRLCLNFCLV